MAWALVTGGAGFIGSHIARKLLESGHSVRVLDNFSTGKMENIDDLKDRIEIVRGDIRDIDMVKNAIKNIDYVFHQAAFVSVPRSLKDPGETAEVNVKGTLNILVCARDSDVKRLVSASSSSVYGDSPALPKKESMPPNPISPYALSKLEAEEWCGLFGKLYGLETVSLRYFNVFGPNQNPNSEYAAVIPKFIKSVLSNKPPTIYGDGTQTRDFTYVKDVIDANLLALKGKPGVYNIGSGKKISINMLLDMINRIAGKSLEPVYAEPRPGDIEHSLADISLARKGLGYNPGSDLEQGLRETMRWSSEGTG